MKVRNWLGKLKKLRINRAARLPSPHKPLFLLALLDLYGEGRFRDGTLRMTPELYLRFQACWSAVQHRTRQPPLPQFPFHYLSSDGLWKPFMADGQPSHDVKTTRFCVLDPGFLEFLQDAASRDTARYLLIHEYFTDKEQVIIRVAGDQFEETSHFGHSLRMLDGRPLFFAPDTTLRPDPTYFEWHREKRFGMAFEKGYADNVGD